MVSNGQPLKLRSVELETVPCPLCGSSDVKPFLTVPGYVIGTQEVFVLSRCDACGFVHANPRIPSDRIAEFYPDDYHAVSESCVSQGTPAGVRREWARIRAAAGCREPGRLLDFGSGIGMLMRAASDSSWDAVGVEIVPAFRATSRRVAPDSPVFESLRQLREALPTLSFNLATAVSVIEHLPDPVVVLTELRSLLTRAGRVVVVVPTLDCWEFERFREQFFYLALPHHYSHFTPDTLQQALDRAGFECQRIKRLPVCALLEEIGLQRGQPVYRAMLANPQLGRGAYRLYHHSLPLRTAAIGLRFAKHLLRLVARTPEIMAIARPRL